MRRKEKINLMAEQITWFGKGKLKEEDALKEANAYYQKKPLINISEWLTHVGDQYVAKAIADRMLAKMV